MPVIDASAILKIILDEEHSSTFQKWYQEQLRQGAVFSAPGILPYEMAHALWRRVPASRQNGPHWTRNLIRDLLMPIDLDHDAWARVDRWRGHMSAYDAAYLSLAELRDDLLVTYDQVMKSMANAAGVTAISPGA
jgi:predicted nucleic acid-binding protein